LHFKVGTKIIGGFILVLLLTILVGTIGIITGRNLGNKLEQMNSTRLPSVTLVDGINSNLTKLRLVEWDLITSIRHFKEVQDRASLGEKPKPPGRLTVSQMQHQPEAQGDLGDMYSKQITSAHIEQDNDYAMKAMMAMKISDGDWRQRSGNLRL